MNKAWMKKRMHFFCVTLTVLAAGFTAVSASAMDVYVSPAGNDLNPGTLQSPLATLEKARDWVREHKGTGPVTVFLRAGNYALEESLAFTAEDSGTEVAPIVYRAYQDESVHLVGGRVVAAADFKPVSDPKILARMEPSARGKIVELDLARLGVRHAERPPDLFEGTGGLLELYCNNQRQPVSRWPNGGYTTMKEVIDGGSAGANGHGGSFVYRGDHPGRWREAVPEGLWIAGFWRVPWVIQAIRVQSINTQRNTITQAVGVPQGIGSKYTPEVNGTRHGDGKEPWYAMNLLEEIDQPGEWCIRFPSHTLYFWPPTSLTNATMLIADMDAPLVAMKNVSHVTLQNLVLEAALGPAIQVEGGEAVHLAGCTIRNTGSGVKIVSGQKHLVESCDFYEIGAAALELSGGDRLTLTPAGNTAINNHIHDCGRTLRTAYAVLVDGVGNRFSRNLLHDLPSGGVRYTGNDHLFEGNEIHNIGLDAGDLGAFYSAVDWASRGSVIRGNFIHHSPNANAIYLDDGHSGDHVLSNLAYLTGCGPFVSGGHDHEIRGNLVIESKKGLHLDDRGVPRHYNLSSKAHVSILPKVNYHQPPYAARYPELVAMMNRPELLEYPTGNRIEQNAFVACLKARDVSVGRASQSYVKFENNLDQSDDGGTIDPQTLELRPAAVAAIRAKLPGFVSIAMDKVGLYPDAYRHHLPTTEETDRNHCRPPRRMFDSNVDMEQSSGLKSKASGN